MTFKPTNEQWAVMVDCGMSSALKLRDWTGFPFVYDRTYGLYAVSPGHHVFAMAFLLDLHLGNDGIHYFNNMCDRYPDSSSPIQKAADEYLTTIRGTAFGSSMSKSTTSGFEGSLGASELRYFGDNIRYLR